MQLIVVLCAVGLAHICSAQMACSGTVTGIINSDVTCTGACVLDGATVNGNVLCSTGTLLARGSSSITGNIQADGDVTDIDLDTVTVSGAVEIKDASMLNKIVIQQGATLNAVTIDDTPASVEVSGSLGTLAVTNGESLTVDGLTTTGGITVNGGDGTIQICGSSIGGSLLVNEQNGDINIDTNIADCGATDLSGGVTIELGTSVVTIRGTTTSSIQNADISILKNTGDVTLDQLELSDLNLEENSGTISINEVTIDSDSTLIKHTGDILLSDIEINGDANIKEVEGSVMLTDSNLGSEDISINLVTEDVTVDNNINLNLNVEENEGVVTISDNTIGNAGVNKNTGGVEITGNTITTLSCSDNTPDPTGSGNTITFPDGQCATL